MGRYNDPNDFRGEDVIDSRDLIEYGNELASRLEDEADDLDDDEREALEAINELAGEGIEDWEYGATLIHERYFITYAQELAEDLGEVSRDYSWPSSHIDWVGASDALKQDYSCVTLLGHDYWVRS